VEDLYLREEGVSQIVLSVRDGGSSATRLLLDRLETRLDAVPPPTGRAILTGTVKLSQILWDRLLGRFLPGVGLSVLLIWLSLSWMFRSTWVGLLSLLPNLFPLAVLAGLLAVGGFDLKPSSALVFSMVFGIVADDTIHMLSALADEGWRTGSPGRRLTRLFDDVGPALVLSTVVVCGGFGVLMASRFEALFLIGLLTSLAALLALGADLVGLPHLFRAAGLVGSVESPPPRSPS
jgi:predicted RND superfamily exporter protein